jgi:hypothetical protein
MQHGTIGLGNVLSCIEEKEGESTMAIGDSLQQLIASQRAAKRPRAAGASAAEKKELSFAPVLQQLRKLVGGMDERYVKHKLTKNRAVIRVGRKSIDLGWDIQPNPAITVDSGAPPFKVIEARNFMHEDRQDSTLWFVSTELLVNYLEAEIARQTASYRD